MAILILLAIFLIVAVLAPLLGIDTSDAHSEDARPDNGWWAAGPTELPHPRL